MAKHLARIIMTGAQIVGKAFSQAVRQEIRTLNLTFDSSIFNSRSNLLRICFLRIS